MNYKKYTWIGNKIKEEDMKQLYHLKQKTGKHITILVAEAIQEYLIKQKNIENEKDDNR